MSDIYVNQTVTGSNNIVAGTGDIHVHYEVSAGEAKERRELLLLLGKVRQSWIKGLLEHSLHNELRIELGTEEQPAAVASEDGLEMPPLPPEKQRLVDIFHDAQHALLILGAPGSGKTYAMLELARDLLDAAEQDPRLPIPVVFNLSSWGDGKQTLKEWLIDELHTKYRIRKETGKSWLEQNYLMLFLDGLDEVRQEHRASCVEAINAYSLDAGLSGLVVCSRMDEYMVLPVRLMLNRAVCLTPLTPQQIDAYLADGGERLAALRAVLEEDDALQTLSQTPLMLHVMSLAYQGRPVEEVAPGGDGAEGADRVETRRRQLFRLYVDRMFGLKGPKKPRRGSAEQVIKYSEDETITYTVDGAKPQQAGRKGAERSFSREETTTWLSWLARQMQRHSKVVFLLEEMQPSWLEARKNRWMYGLASRLIAGLLMGLAMGLTLGLLLGMGGDVTAAFYDVLAGVAFGVIFGLAGGLIAGLLFALRYERADVPTDAPQAASRWQVVLDISLYVIVLAMVGAGLIFVIGGPQFQLSIGLLFGSFLGLVFGLMFGLRGKNRDMGHDIRTVEALEWSWTKARQNGLRGAMGGMVVAIGFGLVSGMFFGAEDAVLAALIGLVLLVAGALAGAVFGALFGGLSSVSIERKTMPNQGIRLSARNAVLGGLRIGIAFWIIFALILWPGQGLITALVVGLVGGLFFAMMAGLYYGALNVVQHYVLRLMLIRLGHTPSDYVPFLDYTTRLIFMRRIGGGYIFIHRFLLEYFASEGAATAGAREQAPKIPEPQA